MATRSTLARQSVIVFVLAAAGAVGIALTAIPAAAEPAPPTRMDLRGVNFVSACGFSHRAPDDPIVHPGRPGRSHDHSFVGSRSTNAFSTLASLRSRGTSCMRSADTAAYWMPTLFVDGKAVVPNHAQIYYRRKTIAPVRAFPPGLKMIAGDATARHPQPRRVTFWNCGIAGGVQPSATVPTCPDSRRRALRLHVSFPSCWDGVGLDSADHQSHVAYATRGRCPRTHPVELPAITLIFRYAVTGAGEVELASGGQFSAHADFFNAWDEAELERLVDGCLNALRHCARGD